MKKLTGYIKKKIFLTLIVSVIIAVEVYGQAYIYTPEGKPVSVTVYEENYDQIASLTAAGEDYIRENGPLHAKLIGDGSAVYNCHAYAWCVSEGGPRYWLNTPNEHSFWTDNSYSPDDGSPSYISCPESQATHAAYEDANHSVRKIQNSYPRAIDYTSFPGETLDYVSKWGAWGLYIHQKGHDPFYNGQIEGQVFDFKKLKTTHKGTLSIAPKTWIGAGGKTHSLLDNVIVPSGASLTIKSGATVNLNAHTITPTGGTITVQNGVTINGAFVKSGTGVKGIYPSIQAALSVATTGEEVYITSSQSLPGNTTVPSGVNFTVYNNATLTINAGTNVLLGSNVIIRVTSGSKIIANGNPGDANAIRFKQLNNGQRWNQIRLESNNNQFSYCVFDGGGYVHLYFNNNNTFSYCNFKNGVQGIEADWSSNHAIDNCRFEGNLCWGIVLWHGGASINQSTVSNNPYSGISAFYSTVTNFTNNKVENNAGGGINMGAGSTIYMGKGAGSYESNYHTDYVPAAADNTEGAGAGRNRIQNNGNSYQIYVDVDSRLYVGYLTTGSMLMDGYNKISSTTGNYIYNAAMTGEYENQQQWVVPASMTRWEVNGIKTVSGSNFYGEVDYSYTLDFDPSINAGASGTVPSKVSNPENESKPITVLTSAIAAKISSTQPTSSQGEFLVELKNKMIEVRNDFNDPNNKKIRPRLLGDLNGLSALDPNDATQEKGMIKALLAEYRERLITNNSTTDSTERLCSEAALVGEIQNALQSGDNSKVQELLKTYQPYVKNKDNVRSLLFAEMAVYERLGDYAKAMTSLNAIKAIKPDEDMKKGYVAPSYDIIETILREKAKEAGIALPEQESIEEEQPIIKEEQPQKEITLQSYPNPFNPSTVVSYQLSAVSNVSLKIYDMLGREVAVLQDGMKEAGRYTATFNASKLASGIYFSRLTVKPNEGKPIVLTKKMLMMK